MQLKNVCLLIALSTGLLTLSCARSNPIHHTHLQKDTLAEHTIASIYLKEYTSIMQTMHQNMASVIAGKDDRVNFLKQMIPHHQGAVDMSEGILKSTSDRRIINLAKGIITDQKNEIALMQELIRQLENENKNHFTHEK